MTNLTPSGRLRCKIELVQPLLLPMQLPSPESYREDLIISYFLNRTSVPLMQTALEHAQVLAGQDPVAAGVAAYLVKHIPEEMHDAAGYGEALLPDLAVLGVDCAKLCHSSPPALIACLVGYHYYWIVHRHPVVLLGLMAVLEGNQPSAEQVEAVITQTGLPRAAFRQALAHTHLDIDHANDLYEVLDAVPLTSEQEALLGLSAFTTADLLNRIAIAEAEA